MALSIDPGTRMALTLIESMALEDQGIPLITYYDDATGERVDVSAGTLRDWATRTANLLVGEYGLGRGANIALLLPAHWQTAAVVLGAWSTGISLGFHGSATAGLAPVGPAAHAPIHAVFASLPRIRNMIERVPAAPIRFALGLAAQAAPLETVPDGYRDFIPAVTAHSGMALPSAPLRATDQASTDGTSFNEWGSIARAMADRWGLHRGDRVLVDASEHEHPLKWLLAPLSVGATIVLCANLDRGVIASRSQAERVTQVL